VLAHSGAKADGDLVRLAGGADADRLEWKAVKSVAAGWERLLASAARKVSANDAGARRDLWGEAAGNRVLRQPWPVDLPAALAEVEPGAFDAKGLGGCPLAQLPAGRAGWLGVTFERFRVTALSSWPDGAPPPIPSLKDGCYHGEEVTLGEKTDLGLLLRERLQERPPGMRVVLHVSGSGDHATSPIQLRDADLVLYFKQPRGRAKPLTLVPAGSAAGKPALIEVAGGGLEMIGVRVRFENAASTPVPLRAVKVRGGKLRLFGCHLQGPLTRMPQEYGGLALFQGSGKEGPGVAHECALDRCVLVSGREVLTVRGPGARLGLRQCAVVALDDGLVLEPGPGRPRLNLQCTLTHNTFAARGGAVRVKDAPGLPAGAEPVVIQADDNLFLDPFAGKPRRSAVLLYQGDALARGVVLWQGKGNGYDVNRLQAFVAAEGKPPAERETHKVWARLWGRAGEAEPRLVEWPAIPAWSVTPDRPQLDRLRLPPGFATAVGADLVKLGIAERAP
jgi:hypothetical protein